ncbi:MAG: ACP phosphodiesterase [Crocinitomicaceae bacterium]
MNFLGHLYFSRDNTDLMAANLMGDFVKGKDLLKFQEMTQKGIRLHRAIDTYIDHHPAVLELLHQLYEPLPKVSGIAVDLYFDHLLAKNWARFHATSLEEFIQQFYASVQLNHPDYSDNFRFMLSKMMEKNWLYQYQFPHGLHKACQGVSSRLSFQNKLVDGLEVFRLFEPQIEKSFELFMADASSYLNQLELDELR